VSGFHSGLKNKACNWLYFALGDIFTMNEIESYIDRKNEEVWEYLPEWMRVLKAVISM